MDFGCHGRQEGVVCDRFFVGSDMDIWRVGKYFRHFFKNFEKYFFALSGLHVASHGAHKCVAMAGHVDFGYDGNAVFFCHSHDFAAVGLCVEFAGEAGHGR